MQYNNNLTAQTIIDSKVARVYTCLKEVKTMIKEAQSSWDFNVGEYVRDAELMRRMTTDWDQLINESLRLKAWTEIMLNKFSLAFDPSEDGLEDKWKFISLLAEADQLIDQLPLIMDLAEEPF